MKDIVLEGASTKDLSGIYNEIAEEFGVDMAYKMYLCFRGQQLTFPLRFYSSECVNKRICEEYDGCNVKLIAKKYGFSERRDAGFLYTFRFCGK